MSVKIDRIILLIVDQVSKQFNLSNYQSMPPKEEPFRAHILRDSLKTPVIYPFIGALHQINGHIDILLHGFLLIQQLTI
jgi:hypothetical protein